MKTNRAAKSTVAIVTEINAAHPADVACKCEFCGAKVVVRPSDPGFKSAREYGYAVCRGDICQKMSNGWASVAV